MCRHAAANETFPFVIARNFNYGPRKITGPPVYSPVRYDGKRKLIS